MLRTTLLLLLAAGIFRGEEARPDQAQQAAMLSAMARYAEKYVSNLPNFLCELTTEQYQSGSRHLNWKRGDTITAQLSFSKGQEKRILLAVNNKPPKAASARWRRPLTTEGEFGSILADVFSDYSSAAFNWKGWETIQGKRVAVFDYSIDKEHSLLKLSQSDLANAIVPYHGSVYGDAETGAIYRISDEANDIPAEIGMNSIGTTVDYQEATIGTGVYLLPSHATVLDNAKTAIIRNELYFGNYRKFEAESSIKFETDPPQPQDQAR